MLVFEQSGLKGGQGDNPEKAQPGADHQQAAEGVGIGGGVCVRLGELSYWSISGWACQLSP